MEETLGKRIVAHRKKLGITQDRLAEQLGVTAQAVSKWENDLSCPDIATLPKLAAIFGISVDALLGIAPQETEKAFEAEIVEPEKSSDSDPAHGASWEFHWDTGRKGSIALAVWIILTAGCMFAAAYYHADADIWDLLWSNGLIVFGLFGMLHKFSFLRLACVLFGGQALLKELDVLPDALRKEYLLPALLLLFGLSLLMEAIRKPKKPHFSIVRNGSAKKKASVCNLGEDTFECSCSFGENAYTIDLPRLQSGSSNVSFGDLTVDLTACGEFCPDCRIDAACAFGEMTVLVPENVRSEVNADTTFGSVDILGNHHPDASGLIHINANVSFGQITVKYI